MHTKSPTCFERTSGIQLYLRPFRLGPFYFKIALLLKRSQVQTTHNSSYRDEIKNFSFKFPYEKYAARNLFSFFFQYESYEFNWSQRTAAEAAFVDFL